jgi:hypothetical protein
MNENVKKFFMERHILKKTGHEAQFSDFSLKFIHKMV